MRHTFLFLRKHSSKKEYVLPIVSPLRGMVTYIGYDKASAPWHVWGISEIGVKCHLNRHDYYFELDIQQGNLIQIINLNNFFSV